MKTETVQEFQIVPIGNLRESPTNPRRHADPARFDELKKSIEIHGVLTPLLVRPLDDEGRLEIIAGERRYRAAKQLGLEELPVRVKPMTDAEALELQIVENLQREDVHPADEAVGYRTLMDKAGYDVPAIADKVNKSTSYVYQRLKLAELVEPAKGAFFGGKITAGHAIQIARLQPQDQKEAMQATLTRWGDGAISVRRLGEWIEQNVHLDLRAALFSKTDPVLVPAAGPCTICPKRTGFLPELFPDIKKKDTCTDRNCFQQKFDAFIARRKAEFQDDGKKLLELSGDYLSAKGATVGLPRTSWAEAKKKSCKSVTTGIIVGGHDKGKVLTVCPDRQCKTHHFVGTQPRTSPAVRAQEKTRAQKQRREEEARRLILAATLAKITAPLRGEDLRAVVRGAFRRLMHEDQKRIVKRHGWGARDRKSYAPLETLANAHIGKFSDVDLSRFLVETVLIGETAVSPHSRTGQELLKMAGRLRINVGQIRSQIKSPAKAVKKASRTQPKATRHTKKASKKARKR